MIARAISIVLLLATVLAIYNVYGDNTTVLQRAEGLACGAAPCVKLLRAQRTPFDQSFTFQTSLAPARTRDVRCARTLLLVGGYDCRAQ